jgi:TetR/AcrR family transcriptional regulator, repressor for uid operon
MWLSVGGIPRTDHDSSNTQPQATMMQTTHAAKLRASALPTRERIIHAARKLFISKGFHAATTAELAAASGVNISLIYRHFASKDDIVFTIAEQKVHEHILRRNAIFDAVKRSELSVFEALKAFAHERLADSEGSLFFEMLAESYRNQLVAERMRTLTEMYRESIRYLAALARPDAPPGKLDVYADLMTACFTGIGYRPAIGIADAEEASHEIACLLMTALGLAEPAQTKVTSRNVLRSAARQKSR